MNYNYILKKAISSLKCSYIPNPHLDSEILLSKALKIRRENLLLNLDKKIKPKELNIFKQLIKRRKKKEPVAYIVGYKEFWKKKFIINKNVLIPRPETELLIEIALKYIPKDASYNILDIGTGSGCLLLSILNERNKCYGTGIDISKKAINIAKTNAKIQHIKNRIKFINSDIDKFLVGKYDLILSNPPYIKKLKIKYLDEDVKVYEPNTALNGGIDGYSKIELVINNSSHLIKRQGKLILEIGEDQVYKTFRMLKDNGFYINKIIKDLKKNNRCIMSTKI